MRSVANLLVLSACVGSVLAVDRSKFKTCKDSGFCRRHRDVETEPVVSLRIGLGNVDT